MDYLPRGLCLLKVCKIIVSMTVHIISRKRDPCYYPTYEYWTEEDHTESLQRMSLHRFPVVFRKFFLKNRSFSAFNIIYISIKDVLTNKLDLSKKQDEVF